MSKSIEDSMSFQIIKIACAAQIIDSDDSHRLANFLLDSKQLARVGASRGSRFESPTVQDSFVDDPAAFLVHLNETNALSATQFEQLASKLEDFRSIVRQAQNAISDPGDQTGDEAEHAEEFLELEMAAENAEQEHQIAPAVSDFTKEIRGKIRTKQRHRPSQVEEEEERGSDENRERRRSRKGSSKRRKKQSKPWRPPMDFGLWYEHNKLFIITAIVVFGIASVAYYLIK